MHANDDPLLAQLADIWTAVLGVRTVGPQDSFFDLGGDSLLAVRVFREIEERFDRRLPVATLFEAPTLGQLSRVIRDHGWTPPWSRLVAIRAGGSKPPLFLLHANGDVLFYRDLARYLPADRPLYGIPALGLDGNRPAERLEDMAGLYVRIVRSCQPRGPYYLAGSSFGGLAAFEMARQLREQGQDVGLLALFDTYPAAYWRFEIPPWRCRACHVADHVVNHALNLAARPARDRPSYLWKLAGRALQRARLSVGPASGGARGGASDAPDDAISVRAKERVVQACRAAANEYVPRPYGGSITLFRARKQPLGIVQDPTMGWKDVAEGGLRIYEVPGYHGECCREPFVRGLAERLNAVLV